MVTDLKTDVLQLLASVEVINSKQQYILWLKTN